ncbi:MAG: 16S rRNA (uracil(1498)-N(3))-methyltransferase [Candidatus Saccharibacteria bacterium]
MRRFYANSSSVSNEIIRISGDEARHIARVLRMEPGDRITVFDGTGLEYLVELTSVGHDVEGQIITQEPAGIEPPVKITLVQGLAKGEKMELIIQKAVELGVHKIIPVYTEYAVVKLDDKKARDKVERWQRIALEACKQCGRSVPPVVEPVTGLGQALVMNRDPVKLFFYEHSDKANLKNILRHSREKIQNNGTAIYIGPEGGFSEAEVSRATEAGAAVVGLGPRILRTETAGLAAVSIVMYELGDIGS